MSKDIRVLFYGGEPIGVINLAIYEHKQPALVTWLEQDDRLGFALNVLDMEFTARMLLTGETVLYAGKALQFLPATFKERIYG